MCNVALYENFFYAPNTTRIPTIRWYLGLFSLDEDVHIIYRSTSAAEPMRRPFVYTIILANFDAFLCNYDTSRKKIRWLFIKYGCGLEITPWVGLRMRWVRNIKHDKIQDLWPGWLPKKSGPETGNVKRLRKNNIQ